MANQYRRILDAGCGNGRVTALLATLVQQAEIVGIDLVDLSAAKKNTSQFSNIMFLQADLTKDLNILGKFDFIYCQEVLHHTGNARQSFNHLVDILEQEGKIAIYVYKKKAPAREFMDAYIRNQISDLDYDHAMVLCRRITELGRSFAQLGEEIEVEDIPLLGIKKGKYHIQRFLYHHFIKCFWHAGLSFEENIAINYDWYHPKICSHHTLDEVRGWFEGRKLKITWSHEDFYGITVHGEKN